MNVDLYDLSAELVDQAAAQVVGWLWAHGTLKVAYTVTVGEDEMPNGLAEALRACGCKDGDSVTVVASRKGRRHCTLGTVLKALWPLPIRNRSRTMNGSVGLTERIVERFTDAEVRQLVERSLDKMAEAKEKGQRVGSWFSKYRTLRVRLR